MKIPGFESFTPALGKITLLIFFIVNAACLKGQQATIDSFRRKLATTRENSIRIMLLEGLGQQYRDAAKIDSSIQSYEKALTLVHQNKDSLRHETYLLNVLGFLTYITGNFSMSIAYGHRALALSKESNNRLDIAYALVSLGSNYGHWELKKHLNVILKQKPFLSFLNPGIGRSRISQKLTSKQASWILHYFLTGKLITLPILAGMKNI